MTNSFVNITSAEQEFKDVTHDVKTPVTKPLKEILLMPSTGECIILKEDELAELNKEPKENEAPNTAEKAIEKVEADKNLTEEKKAEKLNMVLFDSEKVEESKIGEAIKFVECIGLKDKKPVMVAKDFVQKMKDKNMYIELVESKGKSGEDDVFEDYRINVNQENKKDPKRTIFDKKLDKKLRSKYIDKFQPRLAKSKNQDMAAMAAQVVKLAGFESPFKEFLDGTKVDLMEEWAATYSLWNGEHNWNNEEKKRCIQALLRDPELEEKNKSKAKKIDAKFNQDDATKVLKDIKDLWYKKDDTTDYDNIVSGIADAQMLYANDGMRSDLLERVKNTEVPSAIFEASVSASVMRMSAKAKGSFQSDISKGELVKASGEFSADMALAEGKAGMKLFLPNKDGFNAKLKMGKKIEKKSWGKLSIDNSHKHPANFHYNCSFIAPHTVFGLQGQLRSLALASGGNNNTLLGIDVIGHTDAKGGPGYNKKLGLRRADVAFDFMYEDYVGLAHNFQRGFWPKEYVEFMQGVVNCIINDFSGIWAPKDYMGVDFKVMSYLDNSDEKALHDAILSPDSLYKVTTYDDTMELEQHHAFLMEQFPVYAVNAHKLVDEAKDLDMPELKESVKLVDGYNNKYILGLLKVYRNYLWKLNSSGNLIQPFVRYSGKIESKGEEQLKEDTQDANEANRRVVLKGYVYAATSTLENTYLDFGHFRMDVHGEASGYAGANVMLSGSANVSVNSDGLMLAGSMAENKKPRKTVKNEKGLEVLAEGEEEEEENDDQAVNAEAEAEAGFFAGAKAEAGLKAFLKWHESQPEKEGWWELGSVGYAVTGSVGLSAEAEFKIGYNEKLQRFVIKAKASATLGLGGGGKVEFSVGLGGLWKFVQYVYKQIKENDFTFVDFFEDQSAFTVYCSWYVKMLQGGIDLAIDAGKEITEAALEVASRAKELLGTVRDMKLDWEASIQEKEELVKMVESIERNDEMLEHATPEVKGRILYLLTQYRTSSLYEDWKAGWDYDSRSENAAVKLIKEFIVSKRDWQETFEHMACEAQRDGKKAKPYLGNENKNIASDTDKLKGNEQRMLENETWLKNYFLNDRSDWKEVKNKKQQLWN